MQNIKVKFCGFTNLRDAQDAINLGVDYLGFIIEVSQSKRNISIENFLEIIKNLKNFQQTKIVAVLVNLEKEKIDLLVDSGFVDIIQFHGGESKEICAEYKERGIEVWRVFNIDENLGLDEQVGKILKFKNSVDKILLDATSVSEKEQGQVKRFLPDSLGLKVWQRLVREDCKLVLAGGLNIENIDFYLNEFRPEIVDLITGVEERPGKKSLTKMRAFMEMIK